MILSGYTLKNISSDLVCVPDESLFELPEKILQFGTGLLLRGSPDYFIDKANRKGIFNGRIVAVESGAHENIYAFDKQDGLYTHCIRDFKEGQKIEETIINSSISRVLNATEHWSEVLRCAHSRDIQIIISNTSENGIELASEDIHLHPPKSYPGKLLAFLYERFKAFNGSAHSGMVIIPIEEIPENGTRLESIVLELAHLNGLEDEFIEWLEDHNHFCNSSADRIISDKKNDEHLSSIENELGYQDNLLIVSEDYGTWTIEGDEKLKDVLPFVQTDDRIVVEPDIAVRSELKLYLLKGTHILSSGVAFLAGCKTVEEAMNNKLVLQYITELVQHEIAPVIPSEADLTSVQNFGSKVLERFHNAFVEDHWLNITTNYSSKIKLYTIPVLIKHYKKTDVVPEAISLGLAAYIYFMKVVKKDNQYFGDFNSENYLMEDEQQKNFHNRLAELNVASVVQLILSDAFWGVDLLSLPGFKQSVIEKLNLIINHGMKEAIESIPSKKIKAA